jgi:glycosyltransferase involved in cell wall biosynthesis
VIAMLAPPWIPVPPPAYGGIESVVALLCDGLVRRGHDVHLFSAPGSRSPATVRTILPRAHPAEMERSLHEADHVAGAFEAIELAGAAGVGFDVVHDHCAFTAFAMADRLSVPLVHTLHGPFTPETSGFYRRHRRKAQAVAISEAQRAAAPLGLRIAAVVSNPIDARNWPYREDKADYLLWAGRMDVEKGPHRAVAAAQRSGLPLVLAGPVQSGQEEFFESQVAPHVDGEAVSYVGEVGGEEKCELFASARALLMPIRWPEPFGMVMVEALACGTPVIAFPEGAACEIVRNCENGFLVDDEEMMCEAIARLGEIDPETCRAQVVERFDVERVAAAYEGVYEQVAAGRAASKAARAG